MEEDAGLYSCYGVGVSKGSFLFCFECMYLVSFWGGGVQGIEALLHVNSNLSPYLQPHGLLGDAAQFIFLLFLLCRTLVMNHSGKL